MTGKIVLVIIITMPGRRQKRKAMTDILRESLQKSPSLNAVAKATGVQKASLVRFVSGRQSLRLDVADRLADYFQIVFVRRKDR